MNEGTSEERKKGEERLESFYEALDSDGRLMGKSQSVVRDKKDV